MEEDDRYEVEAEVEKDGLMKEALSRDERWEPEKGLLVPVIGSFPCLFPFRPNPAETP